jgi:GT2 family glycosyltransferase
MAETRADIAFVFVATNERELLLQAVNSIYTAGLQRSFEIMVVDNASTDGTAHEVVARFPAVGLVPRESRQGLAANLNEGIIETSAPYVILCNCDIIFTQGSIDTLADFLDANPAAGMAAPALYSPEGEFRPSARRWYTWGALLALKGPWRALTTKTDAVQHSVYADWERDNPRKVDWVPCPATMIRREALEETGLLDERFPLYFNDVDISLRMHNAGWEAWCVPEAAVLHLEQRASLSPLSPAWWSHLGSLVTFWFKHRGLRPGPVRIIEVSDQATAPPVEEEPFQEEEEEEARMVETDNELLTVRDRGSLLGTDEAESEEGEDFGGIRLLRTEDSERAGRRAEDLDEAQRDEDRTNQ